MMKLLSVDVRGSESLQRKMRELPSRVRSRVTRNAVNAAATIVLQAARRLVPRRTRLLAKSLGRRGKTSKHGYYQKIGARRSFQVTLNGRVYRASRVTHLVEKGVRPHMIASRRHPGARPKPFLEPALRTNIHQVKTTMASKMWSGIEAEALRS